MTRELFHRQPRLELDDRGCILRDDHIRAVSEDFDETPGILDAGRSGDGDQKS